jgi:amino acid transporter
MNNLAAVVAPVIVPYYGGGIDISLLPTWAISGLMLVVTLLLVLICTGTYFMTKDEFTNTRYGVDMECRIMTIVIDILSVITIIACGFFYYICIDEIISRF